MSIYIGKKCIACEEAFKKDDEIVVCPDCGTPYHRECYKKEGKCINNTLHANNQSWNSVQIKDEVKNDDNKINCSKCGEENSSTTIFCTKCGNPLEIKIGDQTPDKDGMPQFFNSMMMGLTPENTITPESEIDGIKVKDFSTFIGSNPLYYLMNFVKTGKFNRKISVNFAAFLFPDLYFFYRKMYLPGIIVYLLRMFISIPMILVLVENGSFDGTYISELLKGAVSESTIELMGSISSLISTVLLFSCSLFANFLYYKKAKKTIEYLKSQNLSEDEFKEELSNKGGTSFRNVFIVAVLPVIITIISMMIYNFL